MSRYILAFLDLLWSTYDSCPTYDSHKWTKVDLETPIYIYQQVADFDILTKLLHCPSLYSEYTDGDPGCLCIPDTQDLAVVLEHSKIKPNYQLQSPLNLIC